MMNQGFSRLLCVLWRFCEQRFFPAPAVNRKKRTKRAELLHVPAAITSYQLEGRFPLKPLVLGLVALAASAAPPPLAFEVASIKPAPPPKDNRLSIRTSQDQGRLTMTNVSLRNILTQAYKVKEHQLTTPDWMETTRFDITAKLPQGATKDQVPEMLQTLLADRFKLTMHKESKVLPVYALVAAKGGPKLHEVESAGGLRMMMSPKGREMSGRATLNDLADTLSNSLDRAVIDATGLKGIYEIQLAWTPDESDSVASKMQRRPAGPEGGDNKTGDSADSPTLFVALQEKMGLKLEPRKSPAEIIVVDSAEKVPTEN
jgi:uncharacterized protein (TIGR03435 family)